jgi:UDP-N-acetylmuramyl pentapeptide phosphotransferase/UDP-N-acetylglucosamine-1-phosphate transferase
MDTQKGIMVLLIFYAVILFVFLKGYLKIAPYFNLVDIPNSRSSHQKTTIRGGGIVFPIAWFLWFFGSDYKLYYLTMGVFIIAVAGFLDDRYNLPLSTRLSAHFIAFALLAFEMNWHHSLEKTYWIPLLLVGIGIMNAFNFMDGINGITGLYALSVLGPIQFFLIGPDVLYGPVFFIILSILVFGWFNFTSDARCFSGDVGSTSLGYMMVFILFALLLGQPVHAPIFLIQFFSSNGSQLTYFLIFALYGIDTVLTILQRLILKENIFEAHRKHLYQLLANEYKWPHLAVASVYAFIQLVINIWIFKTQPTAFKALSLLFVFALIYIGLKYFLIQNLNSQRKRLAS